MMDGPDRELPVDKTTYCVACRHFAGATRQCKRFAGITITANRARLAAGLCGEYGRRFEPRQTETTGHRG